MIIRTLAISLLLIGCRCHVFAQSDNFHKNPDQDYLLHSIYFGGGSYFIDEPQQKSLLEFIKSIDNIDHFEISVHAHTDNIGGKAYNDWLAEQRSEAVIGLMEQYSIEKQAISKKTFGKLNPVYDNGTWIGKLKNRRVDIILWPIAF